MNRARDLTADDPGESGVHQTSQLFGETSGVRSTLGSTQTSLATLRPADLSAPALLRARDQLATIRTRLGELREAARACDASAQAESSVLRARRAELSQLCERGVLTVYARVLLDAALGRQISAAAVDTIDRRYGYQIPRDPVAVAVRALRVADGREEIPADDWLAQVLAVVSAARE